jgi:hypothetical protein
MPSEFYLLLSSVNIFHGLSGLLTQNMTRKAEMEEYNVIS